MSLRCAALSVQHKTVLSGFVSPKESARECWGRPRTALTSGCVCSWVGPYPCALQEAERRIQQNLERESRLVEQEGLSETPVLCVCACVTCYTVCVCVCESNLLHCVCVCVCLTCYTLSPSA